MASRIFNYEGDVTPPTVTVDLSPAFEGMELIFPEIELFQGDSATINFAITQGGSPFDLMGYTAAYRAKVALGDPDYVFNESATIADDPTTGKCSVSLSAADLASAQTLVSQLYISKAGQTQTVLQIPLIVQPSV